MYQNIKQNNVKALDSKLYSGHYYDFMLYKGEVVNQSMADIEGKAIADFSSLHISSGILYSTVVWDGAVNNGVEMNDIGYTGVDNGLISFDKTRISNKEFLNLYLNSTYSIESGDTRLFLTPVTGNTQMYDYPMYITEDGIERYIACKGGFYQGFFKLFGHEYQVLPSTLDSDLVFHFDLRPRSDYEVGETLVNHIHPENSGMFFFMGTRAENKFWPFYKVDSGVTETMKKVDAQSEGYFDGCGESGETYNVNRNNVVFEPFLKQEIEIEEGYFDLGDGYMIPFSGTSVQKYPSVSYSASTNLGNNYLNTYDYKPDAACGCDGCGVNIITREDYTDVLCADYFDDEYYDDKCTGTKQAIDESAIELEAEINEDKITDSNGNLFKEKGYYEIETDNKFLLFDRTKDGFTTDTWVEGTKVLLTGRKNWPDVNYFMIMNRTETGYTAHSIDQYNEENSYDYNLYKDVRNNVFGMRITENGAIGYRYGVLNCDDDNENHYELIEEYSKDGVIKKDTWNSINVRFALITKPNEKCDKRNGRMRIMVYVNGFLVFVSKELDALNFKELNDIYQRQEAVPYNISLGGGSLGLIETILPDYYRIPEYILPIERDFCGTFLGDIKSFKIYKGFIDYLSIVNYLS